LRTTALLALCLALALTPYSRAQSPALTARDAWVRLTPGVDQAAVYLTLHNGGPQAVVVSGVHSDAARMAMIHQSALLNGQSTMRPQAQVRIAPGQTVNFAPGGLHIMLHGLTRTPAVGDELVLMLELAGGATLRVSARVRPLTDG
jgi:hypothetical protein